MSRTQTVEQLKLSAAEHYIGLHTVTQSERLQLIEAAAALHSGADVTEYWQYNNITTSYDKILLYAQELNVLVEKCGIPYPLAISGLSREPLTVEEQKKSGVFYTDYRLAKMMASECCETLQVQSTVADLAAGTGILLVAVAQEYKDRFELHFNDWIQASVFAFDLSESALRGAAAAFLSMTNDVHAVVKMRQNWVICDSLFENQILTNHYDIVIGNPPWGKIKISRHTFIKQGGDDRVYGADYSKYDQTQYENEKIALQEYGKRVKEKYDLIGGAEPDMYMAFLQRAFSAAKSDGKIIYLVPAGLIRSKGTLSLREYMIRHTKKLSYTIFDNKTRYFAIDSRFKFVMFSCIASANILDENCSFSFRIHQNNGCDSETILFDVNELRKQRPDLTVPEVASKEEKELFDRIYTNGRKWGDTNDAWFADISREVDMTNDRKKFTSQGEKDILPVIEGRMVQQHRFGAKKYIAGSGRSAKWVPCSDGCYPQHYIPKTLVSADALNRSRMIRAGYCDIAGQTNERAMMSAIIPAAVVCGNKVPTITFPNDATGEMIYLWVGITNSFVFDWMIRRIISTTINYFLLLSLPMPNIEINSKIAQQIIAATKKLAAMTDNFYTEKEMQKLRVEIDVAVARGYGLSVADMQLIMKDFPLLDRNQPTMLGRCVSITPDLLFIAMEKGMKKVAQQMDEYHSIGATAYIPAEMVELTKNGG